MSATDLVLEVLKLAGEIPVGHSGKTRRVQRPDPFARVSVAGRAAPIQPLTVGRIARHRLRSRLGRQSLDVGDDIVYRRVVRNSRHDRRHRGTENISLGRAADSVLEVLDLTSQVPAFLACDLGRIERLVAFTQDVSPGDSRRYASAGADEVGRLAEAFNRMLDRLDSAQNALL